MGNLFSKESLVNMIKQGAPAMPKQPVKPGAKWSSTLEVAVPQVGKMVSLTTLTYMGPAEGGGKPLEALT